MKKKLAQLILITVILVIMMSGCVSVKKENQAPSQPANIYPVQAELVDANNFKARWTASTDPEGSDITYVFRYAQTLEGLKEAQPFETPDNYFLFPSLDIGIWYWQVIAEDNLGAQSISAIWSFTINGEGLPTPKDPSKTPSDPSLIVNDVQDTGFTLEWEEYTDSLYPQNQITYTIKVYEETENNTQNRAGISTSQYIRELMRSEAAHSAETTNTAYTFNGMKANTSYIWTLIASADPSRSTVVGSAGLRTGNRAPSMPELLAPQNQTSNCATDITLSWSASTDPDGDELKYYVYIDSVQNTNKTQTPNGIEQTHYIPKEVQEGKTYYWFILVKDINGAATQTQVRQFTTTLPEGLAFPKNPTPKDAANNIDPTQAITFTWEHEKGSKDITYSLYLSKNPNKMIQQAKNISDKTYTYNQYLEENTTYYWQIEAKDTQSLKTAKSPQWGFITSEIEKPLQTLAQTNSEGTQIELVYDKAMKDPSGKHSQYTLKKTTQTAGKRITQMIKTTGITLEADSSSTYLLSLESPILHTDIVSIDYTPGNIQALDGSYLASYINKPVINIVPGETPIVTQAQTNADGEEIYLTFDKTMQVPPNQERHFTLNLTTNSGQRRNAITVQSVTISQEDEKILNLTLSDKIQDWQTIQLSYTPGTIESQEGVRLESFTQVVTNNASPSQPICSEAKTDSSGEVISLIFDKPMKPLTLQQAQQFEVLVSGHANLVTKASLKAEDNTIIKLTLETPIEKNNNAVLVNYIKGDIQSTGKMNLESFQDKPVNMAAVDTIWVIKDIEWNYSTIQAAIDSPTTENGNLIIVATGTYNETVNFKDKRLHLRSSDPYDNSIISQTIIQTDGQVVTINDSQGNETIFEGFTITGGSTGVYCDKTAPIIRNNIIEGIQSTKGAAIHLKGQNAYGHSTRPVLEMSLIYGNTIRNWSEPLSVYKYKLKRIAQAVNILSLKLTC